MRLSPGKDRRCETAYCRIGVTVSHRVRWSCGPVRHCERDRSHAGAARRQPARSDSVGARCPARSGSPRLAAAACEPQPARSAPAELVTADAEAGLDFGLERLVGQFGGVTAQQLHDVDGGRGELADEPVGEDGGHSARRRAAGVRFNGRGVSDGAGGLFVVQGVGESPEGGSKLSYGPCSVIVTRPIGEAVAVEGWRRTRPVSPPQSWSIRKKHLGSPQSGAKSGFQSGGQLSWRAFGR
jgi:hypothetical protein